MCWPRGTGVGYLFPPVSLVLSPWRILDIYEEMNSHWLPPLTPLTRPVLQAGKRIQKGAVEGQRNVIRQPSRSTSQLGSRSFAAQIGKLPHRSHCSTRTPKGAGSEVCGSLCSLFDVGLHFLLVSRLAFRKNNWTYFDGRTGTRWRTARQHVLTLPTHNDLPEAMAAASLLPCRSSAYFSSG